MKKDDLLGILLLSTIMIVGTILLCFKAEQIDNIDAKKELPTYHETNG